MDAGEVTLQQYLGQTLSEIMAEMSNIHLQRQDTNSNSTEEDSKLSVKAGERAKDRVLMIVVNTSHKYYINSQ